MGAKKNNENEVKVNVPTSWAKKNLVLAHLKDLETRVIALERGLEGVLRRLEEAAQPDDAPGWYGRPE